MNKTIITILSIIIIMVAVFTAITIYKINNKDEIDNIETKIAEENILDDCTDEYEEIQEKMLQASTNQEKISPNCFITFKTNYKKCGHETNQYEKIKDDLVNKTKEELQNVYSGWKIEDFSESNILLSKDEDGYCDEHYLVQDKEGKVTIYKILEDGKKQIFQETEISTEYLSDFDKIQIKEGIRVNGKQNLNQLIEDFE
ncbi:MAG: BofC C-terminal domain-containing protein [Clostridia bacterium]|nr:BofC C-terminal domain-containing protein [Clostridia bacterium]